MRRRIRGLGLCAAAMLVLAESARAQSASASVQMTVTPVVNLTVSTSTTSLSVFTAAEFNAGHRTGITGPTLTVKANRAWTVSITGATWTGTGNHSKPVSDLQWSRDNSTYTGLTTSPVQILPSSGTGSPTNGTVQGMFYRWLLHTGTPLPEADAPQSIATLDPGTGTIATSVGSGFRNRSPVLGPTAPAPDPSFEYALGDFDRDGKPDLFAIQKCNTGTGRTEVTILAG